VKQFGGKQIRFGQDDGQPGPTDVALQGSIRKTMEPAAFRGQAGACETEGLFEAARGRHPATNEQPWAYLVVTNDDPGGVMQDDGRASGIPSQLGQRSSVLAITVASSENRK